MAWRRLSQRPEVDWPSLAGTAFVVASLRAVGVEALASWPFPPFAFESDFVARPICALLRLFGPQADAEIPLGAEPLEPSFALGTSRALHGTTMISEASNQRKG